DFFPCVFVRLGRRIGEVMEAAMHVGIFGRIDLVEAIEHGLRLLRRGGVVEIHQRFAIDLHGQDGKIPADALDVVGPVGRGGTHIRPSRIASQATTLSISASRRPACSIPSIASPTKAWISRAWASFFGMPRA